MARDNRVLVVSMLRGSVSHSYYVSRDKADAMIAAGQATGSTDGTRRIFARQSWSKASVREWRKVTNRSRHGVPLYSSMQLVEPRSSRQIG